MATTTTYQITFAGFLMVRLMEFDYAGKHYSYHGRKLDNAVRRLMAKGGPRSAKDPQQSTAELVIWGQADYDWKQMTRGAR